MKSLNLYFTRLSDNRGSDGSGIRFGKYPPKRLSGYSAFYAVVKLPVDDADTFAKWLLEEFEYNKQTVMVAPASGFYSTPGLGKDEVRIAYVLKIEELKGAMETLAKALEVYPGRV